MDDYLVGLEEHLAFRYASETEADYEFARNVGRAHPERAWISSDRDAWYRNPFYEGPLMPHPEDDVEDVEAWRAAELARRAAPPPALDDWPDDIPF